MSVSLFTAPLDQVTAADVEAFLDFDLPEGIRLDYKDEEKNAKGPPSSIVNVIVAFANTQGGLLILGVEADKQTNRPIKREGLTFLKKSSLEEAVTSRCYNSIIPPIAPEVRVCPFKSDPNLTNDDRAFVIIRVRSEGTAVYSTSDNRVLVRVGSECRDADLMTLRFLFEREQKQIELVKQHSYELSESYWSLRQHFMSEILAKAKRWSSSPERLYIECVPLDTATDLLPFGSLVGHTRSLDDHLLNEISRKNWNVLQQIILSKGLGLLVDFNQTIRFAARDADAPVSLLYLDKSGGMFVNLAAKSFGYGQYHQEVTTKVAVLLAKLCNFFSQQLQEHNYIGRVAIQLWATTETWEQNLQPVNDPVHPLAISKKHGFSSSSVFSVLDAWEEQAQIIARMLSQLTRSWLKETFELIEWQDVNKPNFKFSE